MGGMSGPDSPTGGGAGDLRTAKSRLGQAYEMVPSQFGDRSLFGGARSEATLREVQVRGALRLSSESNLQPLPAMDRRLSIKGPLA
jgi:hypothetical protein